ncbi:MAG: hypothetical protein JW910_11490 [Anaerolineae bacterium]|nr:hypothetical protein [Anaerolineae bacterium]
MTDFTFSDPNINARGTFSVNSHTITAPVYTKAELPDILAATRRHAQAYYNGSRVAFDTLTQSYRLWSDPTYSQRQRALPIMAEITGFSPENIACFGLAPLGLKTLDVPFLSALHEQLGLLIESGWYEAFTPWQHGLIKGYGSPSAALQERPRQILHNIAGNVVGPSWLALMLGPIAQAPQFVKLPKRDLVSYMFYLQTLEEIAPEFRRTIACGYYEGGGDLEGDLMAESDVVMALGSNETMAALTDKLGRVNPRGRMLEHGWSLSFQVVSKAYATPEVAELAAWGVAAHDGNACFSPANIYVEAGGPLSPTAFAEAVAAHLDTLAAQVPPKRTLAVAQRVTTYRQQQLKRRLTGKDVRVIKPKGSDYTVVIDASDPSLMPTCQERAVMIKPVKSFRDVPLYVEHLGGHLQTVGLAVPYNELPGIADRLGARGATNVRMLGTEYVLDLAECHDGLFNTAQMFMTDNLRWLSASYFDTEHAIMDALAFKAASLNTLAA